MTSTHALTADRCYSLYNLWQAFTRHSSQADVRDKYPELVKLFPRVVPLSDLVENPYGSPLSQENNVIAQRALDDGSSPQLPRRIIPPRPIGRIQDSAADYRFYGNYSINHFKRLLEGIAGLSTPDELIAFTENAFTEYAEPLKDYVAVYLRSGESYETYKPVYGLARQVGLTAAH